MVAPDAGPAHAALMVVPNRVVQGPVVSVADLGMTDLGTTAPAPVALMVAPAPATVDRNTVDQNTVDQPARWVPVVPNSMDRAAARKVARAAPMALPVGRLVPSSKISMPTVTAQSTKTNSPRRSKSSKRIAPAVLDVDRAVKDVDHAPAPNAPPTRPRLLKLPTPRPKHPTIPPATPKQSGLPAALLRLLGTSNTRSEEFFFAPAPRHLFSPRLKTHKKRSRFLNPNRLPPRILS